MLPFLLFTGEETGSKCVPDLMDPKGEVNKCNLFFWPV